MLSCLGFFRPRTLILLWYPSWTNKTTSEHASDVAVFPLAIPMMASPGAIATTLLLTGDAGYGARLAIIILVVVFVCLLCFVSAGLIARTLGRTGNAVLSRVLGMLLAAYSVHLVINGIAAVRTSLS